MADEIVIAETTTEIEGTGYTPERVIVNTIDATTIEGKKVAYNAVTNAESLDGFKNVPLEIHDIVQKQTTRVNSETGETVPCVSTILVATDGKGYFTNSVGVARSIASVLTVFGTPDQWPDHTLTMCCTEQRLSNGRMLKSIDVL